jgi:hypothetical protein
MKGRKETKKEMKMKKEGRRGKKNSAARQDQREESQRCWTK